MSASSAALLGRRAAEMLMVDDCTISRPSTLGAFDASTGLHTAVAGDVVYAGRCQLKAVANSTVVEAGEQPVSLWPYIVSVPVSAVDVQLDDVVTIIASQLDAAAVGLVLRVRQVATGTYLMARHLSCELNAG